MKKILIIEDNALSFERIKDMLARVKPDCEVYGPLASVSEVVEHLSANNDYYLIFSDICLLDGTVFEAFKKVMPKSFVIFTTAYNDYAMEAIKNNGVDYLMKPFAEDEVRTAIQKIESNPLLRKEHVEELVRDLPTYKERFLVERGDEFAILAVKDICFVCKSDNHVTAVDYSGVSYYIDEPMAELEKKLNPDMFFRLNRQYMASMKGIRKISSFFGSRLSVRLHGCDERIVISKERAAAFKAWIDK